MFVDVVMWMQEKQQNSYIQ